MGTKTCINGHTYNDSEQQCPFCRTNTILSTQPINPMINHPQEKTEFDNDKTVIDTNPTSDMQNNQSIFGGHGSFGNVLSNNDETRINGSVPSFNQKQSVQTPKSNRKLVGWLVTYDLDINGTDFKIYEGRNYIGRKFENNIVINSNTVSDVHAILLFRENKFKLDDKLSTNGTFLNSEMVESPVDIKDGDEIRFGDIKCLFRTSYFQK